MDTNAIRGVLIPSIKTERQGEVIARVAELKADELLVKAELLEEDMHRLLGDVASKATRQF